MGSQNPEMSILLPNPYETAIYHTKQRDYMQMRSTVNSSKNFEFPAQIQRNVLIFRGSFATEICSENSQKKIEEVFDGARQHHHHP